MPARPRTDADLLDVELAALANDSLLAVD
jgi:hypothetical protein